MAFNISKEEQKRLNQAFSGSKKGKNEQGNNDSDPGVEPSKTINENAAESGSTVGTNDTKPSSKPEIQSSNGPHVVITPLTNPELEHKKSFSFTLKPSSVAKLRQAAQKNGYRSVSALLSDLIDNMQF